jgi:hypothetical protein
MNTNKQTLGACLLLLLLVSSCATANAEVVEQARGFWYGLLHGYFVGISFIASFFIPTIGVYEVVNNGGWYDFGFVLGVGAFSGSCTTCKS